MVVLGGIRGEPSRWKQFVRNRVTEIHSMTDPALWAHCPGQDNPADLITRGMHAEALTDSFWFSGPDWLKAGANDDVSDPPELDQVSELEQPEEAEDQLAEVAEDQLAEEADGQLAEAAEGQLAEAAAEQLVGVAVVTHSSSEPVIEVERFSSLIKAIRVVGLVLRFIRRLKARRASGRRSSDPPALSYVELSEARVCLIKVVQFQVYSAECQALTKGKALDRHSRIASLCRSWMSKACCECVADLPILICRWVTSVQF